MSDPAEEAKPQDATPGIEAKLADGSAPLSPPELLQRLAEMGLQTRTMMHPPVFTVEEAKALRGQISGAHIKNLFLRSKKGAMWLVTCLEDRPVDLKWLGAELGGRLSFGSAERLMRHLGVIPGAVTPFAAINDKTGEVEVVLDRALLELAPINAHPLANDMTTAIEPQDLMTFLEAVGHPPRMLDFPA